MFFDKKASVERMTAVVGNPRKGEYQAVTGLESFDCNVQPASAETIAIVNGIYGKTYQMFTTVSGIKEGDRVTISGSFIDGITTNKQLRVSSVGNWDFGPLPHFELVVTDLK